MPRSNRHHYPSLDFSHNQHNPEDSVLSGDEGRSSESEGDIEPEDMELTSDNNMIGSDLFQHLASVSDEVLTFVAAGCLNRSSDAGFQRYLSSHNEHFRHEAMGLWKNDLSTFNKHFVCNGCGREVNQGEECCGSIIKYIRVGASNQLIDIVVQYMDKIKEIRGRLQGGVEDTHNLTGSYLRKLWEQEKPNQLKLSIIGSIDGVSLTGNTKSKLWPVTMLIVDLPTGEMQRAKNLSIHGIAEGPVNPSTHFWNKIIPMIYADVETEVQIQNMEVSFTISTWVADQPAKRSLFGFKGCNAESSCFFGMCSGTHTKKIGPNRSIERGEELTDEDASLGRYGFGNIAPKILDYIYPYDTIIDILHNASEGIFSILLKETLSPRDFDRRSDLFQNDNELHLRLSESVTLPPQFRMDHTRNCSDRLTYFRLNFGLAALVNPTLKPRARLSICALMLLLNKLYTNAPSYDDTFFGFLVGAARYPLENVENSYLATKAHELLAHLPYVIQKFGNVAALSTFSFEHFYKYCLKGFNTQKTKGFTEAAVRRVILHSAIRREIQSRSLNTPSATLTTFLSHTPELKPFKCSWKHPICSLKQEDVLDEIKGFDFFSTVTFSIGRLQSKYLNKKSSEDVFFARNANGFHSCYIFLAFCVHGPRKLILAERVRSVKVDETFPFLRQMLNEMPVPDNTYASNVLMHFKRYDGMVHGNPSGEKEVLEEKQLRGVGGYLRTESSAYYLQLNGSCIHH